MILLPSRGRPHLLKRFIKAWEETASKSCGVVVLLDKDDESNSGVEFPSSWIVHQRPRISIAEHLNFAVNEHEAPAYGLMNDDAVPITKNWDELLIEGAIEGRIVWPDDCYNQKATFPFVKGSLIRALRFYAAPGLKHLYIDTFWGDISEYVNARGFMPGVKIHHYNNANGGPTDDTYTGRIDGGDESAYNIIRSNFSDYWQAARRAL